MNREKKIIRNLIIVGILSLLFIKISGLYLTPIGAHEASERSIHYGPSQVVHIESFPKGKYVLGKYDKWISCNTVNRTKLFFWRFGNQPVGIENDLTKPIAYTWSSSDEHYKIYGIINDDQISQVELTLDNGTIFTQEEFYEDMFLFAWDTTKEEDSFFDVIRGYDSEHNMIFEELRYR